MPESEWLYEKRSCGEGMKRMGRALHDLCQPLTALQCRLEIAEMTGTQEAQREAVAMGLADCARLVEAVLSMREIVRAATQQADAADAGDDCADRSFHCLREG